MSEVKVNKITPTTDCGTVTLGDSGDTVAIPSGVTLTSAGSITNSGTITNTGTITGGTITGTIDNQANWQTGSIKTSGFTATAGEGYFCNTTSGAFTVTLPASPSAGDIVGIKDYAATFDTNNLTVGRNGSNIQGVANDFVINTENASVVFIYVDATKGWLTTASSIPGDLSNPLYVTATGGTITTSGNFKIHTFTGPGTFCVSCAGNSLGSNTVSYMVVAGGGGGGGSSQTPNDAGSSGGGAGGYREGKASTDCYTASPLNAPAGLPVAASPYPITVGGGGAGINNNNAGSKGVNSTFSTITSAGGGGGGGYQVPEGQACRPIAVLQGGSGGGGGTYQNSPGQSGSGTGNQPPVSPPQGNDGGNGTGGRGGAGGGGAGAVGCNGSPSNAGNGGNGVTSEITGSPVTRGGGGGGGSMPGTAGSGGTGGGGDASNVPNSSSPGTANTGGGGAGGGKNNVNTNAVGKAGGSGIVVIRYKFQN
jgi:hypothetical protein